MLAGKLRVLGANDPDPYPDAVRIEAFAPVDDDDDCVSVGGRRKGSGRKVAKSSRVSMFARKKAG